MANEIEVIKGLLIFAGICIAGAIIFSIANYIIRGML